MKPRSPTELSLLRDIAWSLWDPIELRAMHGSWEDSPAADEYDGYMLHALALIRDGATDEQIAAYLASLIADHMGLEVTGDTQESARRTIAALRRAAGAASGSAFRVFEARAKPRIIVELRGAPTPEQMDAVWMGERAREALTTEDWDEHPDAIYTLTRDAFLHYLPSVLVLTHGKGTREHLVTQALIATLDRSPDPDMWDDFLVSRFGGLTEPEYAEIAEWVGALSPSEIASDGSACERALATLSLLKAHANPFPDARSYWRSRTGP